MSSIDIEKGELMNDPDYLNRLLISRSGVRIPARHHLFQ